MQAASRGEQEEIAGVERELLGVVTLFNGSEIPLEAIRHLGRIRRVRRDGVDAELAAGIRLPQQRDVADQRARIELWRQLAIERQRVVVIMMQPDLLAVDQSANGKRHVLPAVIRPRDFDRAPA